MVSNDGERPVPLSDRCCAMFISMPVRFSPGSKEAHRQTTDNTKAKGPVFRLGLLLYLMPGDSLLSHGETPHYHRRYDVSLLSSAWGQVGPPRYCRQQILYNVPNFNLKSGADTQSRTGDLPYQGCALPTEPYQHAKFDARQFPTLTWGDPTLPSALRRFTSEFGMGSGGTTALVPPGKFCFINTSHQRID